MRWQRRRQWKENLEIICRRVCKLGRPNRECQSKKEDLEEEKAIGEKESISHSYTPPLALPVTSVVPVCRSFTWKSYGHNSTKTLLALQSLLTEIRFLCIEGTQRTFVSFKFRWEEGRKIEPVCVIGRLALFPTITFWLPLYGEWRDKLFRSLAMWWEPPLSSSHWDMSGVLVVTWCACCGHYGVGRGRCGAAHCGDPL